MKHRWPDNARNEDHALFILLKKGDRDAFSAIYEKYHRYLYSLALKYLKSEQIAEDAVQHVFVKLWESTSKIHIEINLKNYLYTMTKNHILNMIRDHKDVISLNYENSQIDIPGKEDILKELENRQMKDILYKGVESLPPQKREICLRKLESTDSNQQIADKMGISVNTVKAHYQESIKMLRQYFEQIRMMMF